MYLNLNNKPRGVGAIYDRHDYLIERRAARFMATIGARLRRPAELLRPQLQKAAAWTTERISYQGRARSSNQRRKDPSELMGFLGRVSSQYSSGLHAPRETLALLTKKRRCQRLIDTHLCRCTRTI